MIIHCELNCLQFFLESAVGKSADTFDTNQPFNHS